VDERNEMYFSEIHHICSNIGGDFGLECERNILVVNASVHFV